MFPFDDVIMVLTQMESTYDSLRFNIIQGCIIEQKDVSWPKYNRLIFWYFAGFELNT